MKPGETALPKFAPYFALVAAVFLAYFNVFDGQFVFDDEMLIVNNALIRSWHSLGAIFWSSSTAGIGGSDLFYRPLQTLLYLILNQAFGLSTEPFHFLNVALHAANAGLLYALGVRLGFRPAAVFLAALIWALHPVQTEAITYMSATADPLYAFFSLIGLLVLLPDFAPRKFRIACVFYALALLSKETAILFPLLAMVSMFFASKKRHDPRFYLRIWPLLAVAAAYLLLRHFALGKGYTFYAQSNIYTEHILYRFYTFLATLPDYAKTLLWPSQLYIDHSFPVYVDFRHWRPIVGAAMLAAALGQIAWGRGRRGLPLSFGLLWFGAAHFLHTGILLPVNAFFLEHWMYLPMAGLFLGIAQSFSDWLAKRPPLFARVAAALALLVALGCGARTYAQNAVWHDPVSLYSHILACGGQSARAHNNLGNAYLGRGEIAPSIAEFRAAIALSDAYAQTHHNLAIALLAQPGRGRENVDQAITELWRALALDPNFFQSYELLANIYAWRGDHDREAEYRAKDMEIRKKLGIPPDEYKQPALAP